MCGKCCGQTILKVYLEKVKMNKAITQKNTPYILFISLYLLVNSYDDVKPKGYIKFIQA